jgi:hypothetical protein
LISLNVNEKKATSDPASKKEMENNSTAKKISIILAAGVIASNMGFKKCKKKVPEW